MDDFINVLLERLLATSLQTGILTTVVWILCRYVPRLSPSSQCWLWWLVALQALLGLLVSPIALPWLPDAAVAVDAVTPDITWTPTSGIAAAPSAAPPIWISWQSAALLLWATGLTIMASITLRDWRHSNALLGDSVPCEDEALQQLLAHDSATCGLRSAPALRVSNRVDSPVLIGHFRPVLLLPADTSLSAEDLDMALVHELTHLRRGDLWWGFIPSLARHLFFFHPFAHLAAREYGIAREASCDAAVVKSEHCSRQDYGRLLVRLGTSPASCTGLAVASPTFFALRRRLTMLQNTTFLPRAVSVAVLAVVAAAGVMPLRFVAAAGAPTVAPATATTEMATPLASEMQTEASTAESKNTAPARTSRTAPATAPAAATSTNPARLLQSGPGLDVQASQQEGQQDAGRGLDPTFGTRTLTMVDGRPIVSTSNQADVVDLNIIPSNLLERMKVVTGGASATYGSGAMRDVVNLVLNNRLTGFNLDMDYGINEAADGSSSQASIQQLEEVARKLAEQLAALQMRFEQNAEPNAREEDAGAQRPREVTQSFLNAQIAARTAVLKDLEHKLAEMKANKQD
ncbi:MAG: M56 family metallopeptidase [Pseudomonadota bacterium]